jgi:hypothetical protein
MSKQRIDTLLVDRGLAESPEKARALVMAGQVLAAERPVSARDAVDEALTVWRAHGSLAGRREVEHALHRSRWMSGRLRGHRLIDGGFTTACCSTAPRVMRSTWGRGS